MTGKNLYPLGCIIMASGSARRFGSNKLLSDFAGQPLICHILDAADGLFAGLVVVTRYERIALLCADRGIACVLHGKPFLNDTIRLGLEYLEDGGLQGYAFCTGDQPLLRRQSLSLLCEAFLRSPRCIFRLAWGSVPGNPMLFPRSLAQELKRLPQDRGGSVLAKKYPELVRLVQVRDKYELFDIDTVRDLRRCPIPAAAEYSEESPPGLREQCRCRQKSASPPPEH